MVEHIKGFPNVNAFGSIWLSQFFWEVLNFRAFQYHFKFFWVHNFRDLLRFYGAKFEMYHSALMVGKLSSRLLIIYLFSREITRCGILEKQDITVFIWSTD